MNVYVDASVLLRKLLGEPMPLAEWNLIDKPFASKLITAEVGRVIDRLRLLGKIDDRQVMQLHTQSESILSAFYLLEIDQEVLARTASALPTMLGTLDAIHLVSALVIQRDHESELVFATHDEQLGIAARASGFSVIGVDLGM